MNVLHMLQFSIAAALVLLAGMWAIYFWLKRTGRLNKVTWSKSNGD
mgnify:CR=1 FL=1